MSRFDLAVPVAPVPTIPADEPVAHVTWPDEADRRLALADEGIPRLLFIAAGHAAPPPLDLYEDWVRVPAPPEEVALRVANLCRRLEQREDPTI